MRTNRLLTGLSLSLLSIALWATPADAQKARTGPVDQRPWTRDIPRSKQEQADELLRKGNDSFLNKNDFAKAVTLYRQSLEIWDHPGTHYNLTLALLNLDRPVEAYAHVTKAVLQGEATLGPEKYAHARLHKETLEKQLAWVEIVCATPDAAVTVGNERLPLINGSYEGLMQPGAATLVATKTGYLLRQKELTLSPGKKNRIHFKLYTEGELVRYDPRWAPWKPWAVVGAGLALSAGGGGLYLKARSDYRAFDRAVADCARAAGGSGCSDPALAPKVTRMRTMSKASVSSMAVGGAALVTGAVLVLLNRAEAHPIDPDAYEKEHGVAVTPVLGGNTNGVLATFQF